jgi:hypothetical protein
VDDSSGDSSSTAVGEPGASVYGKNLLRPVALAGGVLGLTVAGLMLFRRL